MRPEEQQKFVQEFTDHLFGTTSSKFSPTPPREPTPRSASAKGKEVAIIEEQVNKLVKYPKEGEKSEQELRKKVKMMEEYNHLISFRADQLPITMISYVVNPNKEATIKITRGDNPLNLIVRLNFKLRMLVKEARTSSTSSNYEDKKRKRSEFLKEVFVTKNITVDGMHMNQIPPPWVMPIHNLLHEWEYGYSLPKRK
ncbi:hypothetical protein Tco_0890375 [Tanacetum coccineum]|uniref:Uncharacterized protein n=1 Tax=Tanacetum coccineum TaxID=301880 RepID=A0ABQ5C1F5_9ASTR